MAQITETGTIDLKAQKAARDDAAKTATNYITADPTDGIKVHDSGDVTTFVQIASGVIDFVRSGVSAMKMWLDGTVAKVRVGLENAGHSIFSPDGMEVFTDQSTSVARFGSNGARVGQLGMNRIELTDKSMRAFDQEGNSYLDVADMRNSAGLAHLTQTFTGDGSKVRFYLNLPIATFGGVPMVNVVGTSIPYTPSETYITFDEAPASGANFTVAYSTNDPSMKSYTLGMRDRSGTIGPGSYSEGNRNVSSGMFSHAEGWKTSSKSSGSHAEGWSTTASGGCSHAEGTNTVASGSSSHSEGENTEASGINSHAEGFDTSSTGMASHSEGVTSTASGISSHAEGMSTEASGDKSHAQNMGTIAASNNQTALGKYNISDANGTYAVIVGNGTSNSARSNAHTVDWDGDAWYAGDVTDGTGNVLSDKLDSTTAAATYLPLAGGTVTGDLAVNGTIEQGAGTTADSSDQVALGKYNISDTNDTYAVIVGNGTSSAARSNALTVTWGGDVAAIGEITAHDAGGNAHNLTEKANSADMATALAEKANSADMATALASKADAAHTHDGSYAPASHTHLTSQVSGLGTVASSDYQTAIGKYNVEDANNKYAVIVGNGTSDSARSNALAVTWSGDVELGTARSSSIKAANEVILNPIHKDATQYRMCFTGAGNIRLEKSTDSGATWATESYFAKVASGLPAAPGAWQTFQCASGAQAYDANSTPKYCKWGNVVNFKGAFKPTAEVAAGGSLTLGTLPTGYRPTGQKIDVLCQGSGSNVWLLTLQTGGTVTAARYRSGTANQAMTTAVWLPFNVTFMV